MHRFDTLIIGQGIAGSLVAFQLHKQQQTFRVLDAGHSNSASRIAAGMFTPVSGKRKTINSAFFDQLKLAVETYREIESLLGISILHLENVCQLFDNEAEQQLLADKALQPEYRDVFIQEATTPAGINHGIGGITIRHSGWVDCPLFINNFRQWLHQNQLLVEELFEYATLQIYPEYFEYNGMQFRNIIFCEGYRAAGNPFFNAPIIPCKGDIINIAAENNVAGAIIKKNAFYMLPGDDDIRRVGATFKFHNSDETPDATDRQLLEQAAADMLGDGSFTTVGHQSAVRATTPGQQVIAKQHPSIQHMFMLNGLGAKGILLGPEYALIIAEEIVKGKNLSA